MKGVSHNRLVRIGLILLVGVVLLWLLSLRNFYRGDLIATGQLLAPDRLAEVADLIDAADRDRRETLLRILSSEKAVFDVVAKGLPLPDLVPIGGEKIDVPAYRRALGTRDTLIGQDARPSSGVGTAARWWMRKPVYETRVVLTRGDRLVVRTWGPVSLSFTGLPVGLGAGVFGTFVALLALLMMLRETIPLRQLAAAVGRLDPMQTETPIPEPRASSTEIRALVRAYNDMQQRLHGLIRERAAMIGGLSHDVRSFATRLQLRLHLIDDAKERARAESDIADMVHLLDDALLAVRGGAGALEQEMIDWNDLVRDTAEPYLRTGAAVSLDVHPHPSAHGAFVIGDRLSLRRILANLIDNALKYGGKAEISTTADPTRIMCFVDDAGPGIPASQRQILLEPFARLESSRNRGTGGAGLGLAIVKTLVEAHDGSVAIEESPLGGTRIAVSLPRFQTAFAASEIDPRQTAAFAISR